MLRLTALTELDLSDCPWTENAGVEHLSSLLNLQKLSLNWCIQLEDASLEHIARLECR